MCTQEIEDARRRQLHAEHRVVAAEEAARRHQERFRLVEGQLSEAAAQAASAGRRAALAHPSLLIRSRKRR